MTTNDPISDMLTRIRNASAVRKTEVVFPYSKIKMSVAQILVKEGYIKDAEKIVAGVEGVDAGKEKIKNDKSRHFDRLRVVLKYKSGKTVIKKLQRISKPGRRIYKKKDELPIVLNNLGIAIVSTSQGIMTNREAKKIGLGGEVLCEVY